MDNITIPPAALEAGRAAFANAGTADDDRDPFAEACLAMLRAWPGRNTESREILNFGNNIDGPVVDTRLAPFLILPLTEDRRC